MHKEKNATEISADFQIFADFPANFLKFQIFVEGSIFVVEKRQPYEKVSNFNEKIDAHKLK